MLNMLLVEDNLRLQEGLKTGLEATGAVTVTGTCVAGEEALACCLDGPPPDAILMDVALAGEMNGIEAAVAIRREFPRLPVVFYSIQDDDAYFRAFRRAGILSHYAYVRKSNYLLPAMIVPLLLDAVSGRSFVDPEIEARVQEVRHRDAHDPMALLEPNEQIVAQMLAQGLTNEQIAARLGFPATSAPSAAPTARFTPPGAWWTALPTRRSPARGPPSSWGADGWSSGTTRGRQPYSTNAANGSPRIGASKIGRLTDDRLDRAGLGLDRRFAI